MFWRVEGGLGKQKTLKKCMEFNQNFKRVGGILEKNPFDREGMDIFWNYSFIQSIIELIVDMMVSRFPSLEGTEGFHSQGKGKKPIAILYSI